MKIAYFGLESSFTHQAATSYFGRDAQYLSFKNIQDVFSDVTSGVVDFGVVPIENSVEGAVTHTMDMFVDSDAVINAEIFLDIHQNLLGLSPMADIKTVYSHPVAFGQVRNWLKNNLPSAEMEVVSSTTHAAELATHTENTAAVAGLLAAEMYNLNVLARDIEDYEQNKTRFLVISKKAKKVSGNAKTSLLFSVKDISGALFCALEPFKKANINLTRIESRPSKKKAWEYYFYVDIDGHASDPIIAQAIEELRELCHFVKILGSYASNQ